MTIVPEDIDKLNQLSWSTIFENPENSLKRAHEAHRKAKAIAYTKGMYESEINEAWTYIIKSQYPKSLTKLYHLKGVLKQDYPEQYLKCTNALGIIFLQRGNYAQALKEFHQSLAYTKKHPHPSWETKLYGNIAEIYLHEKNYKKALQHYHKSETVGQEGNYHHKPTIELGKGVIYTEMCQYNEAEQALLLAEKTALEENNDTYLITIYCQIGKLYSKLKKDKKTIYYLEKGLTLSNQLSNQKKKAEVYLEFAYHYFYRNNLDFASNFAHKCLHLAKSCASHSVELGCSIFLTLLYEHKGNYKEALSFSKNITTLEREIFHNRSESHINNIEIEYRVEEEKQKAEIFRLRNIELKSKSLELEKSQQQLKIVSHIGRSITASMKTHHIIDTIYKHLSTIMDISCIFYAYYHHEKGIIEYETVMEDGKFLEPETCTINDPTSYAAFCIREDQTLHLEDIDKQNKSVDQSMSFTNTNKPNSLLCVPLKIDDSIIGAFSIQSNQAHAYSEDHVDIIHALSSYIAIAVKNSYQHTNIEQLNEIVIHEKKLLQEANEKITKLANHDSLTELPNRRLFTELFDVALREMKRQKQKLALIFIDLNKFKPINDTYGHEIGDEVLKIFSTILRGSVRNSDIVARLGGDEFVILLKNTPLMADIETVISKIQQRLSEPVQCNKFTFYIHASIGVSIFPDDATTTKELMKMSDEAMYFAKKNNKLTHMFYYKLHTS